MSNAVRRFLGDSPLRVVIKLAVLSLIAGVIMSSLGWSPRDFYNGILAFFRRLWNLGFDAFYNTFEYLLIGAAIVVPAFVVLRILNMRSPRG